DRNHTRRHCGELGHKFADAGAAARDNKAFFGRPHHHIEPILRNIDSDNDRVHLIPPCASGLAVRPKRLFGFDGTAGENPRSPTGLASLGGFGLSPATAPVTLTRAVIRELQGGVAARLRLAERPPHPDCFAIRPLPASEVGCFRLRSLILLNSGTPEFSGERKRNSFSLRAPRRPLPACGERVGVR